MFTVHTLILGPLENNTYIIASPETGDAALIDPSFEMDPILDILQEKNYHLRIILLTHAHFDHMVNAIKVSDYFTPPVHIGLHPSDTPLWKDGGGADLFGIHFMPTRVPDYHFFHGQKIPLGDDEIEVRYTPGHTPGSVIFILKSNQAAITGDLIFFHSVGRTDLPGGDETSLRKSIETQVFTLPGSYLLLPGHGPSTSVLEEFKNNPFL